MKDKRVFKREVLARVTIVTSKDAPARGVARMRKVLKADASTDDLQNLLKANEAIIDACDHSVDDPETAAWYAQRSIWFVKGAQAAIERGDAKGAVYCALRAESHNMIAGMRQAGLERAMWGGAESLNAGFQLREDAVDDRKNDPIVKEVLSKYAAYVATDGKGKAMRLTAAEHFECKPRDVTPAQMRAMQRIINK